MENYLIIIYKTILGYALLYLLMRFMGKREIGQMNLFDFIIILSIADLMVMGIDDYENSIWHSFVPMIIVAVIQKIIAIISLKSNKIRGLLDGKVSYIIIDGKINVNEMKKQRYNMDDLYAQLREEGIKSIQEVETAILESSGKLSVFKNKLEINASLPIITSGKIDYNMLFIMNKDEKWVLKELKKQHLQLEKILGACIINEKLDVVKSIDVITK